MDLDGALELLRLANMYGVPRLSALIEMQVAKHIDVETVCAVFHVCITLASRLSTDVSCRKLIHIHVAICETLVFVSF